MPHHDKSACHIELPRKGTELIYFKFGRPITIFDENMRSCGVIFWRSISAVA